MKTQNLLFGLMLVSLIYSQSLFVQGHVCKNDSARVNISLSDQTYELPRSSSIGLFKLVLLDNKRNIKYEYQTLVSWPFLESLGNNITQKEDLDCAGIDWLPPYSRNLSYFQLYKADGNKLLLEKRLNFCNLNNLCDLDENKLSCPEDCDSPRSPPVNIPYQKDNNDPFFIIGVLLIIFCLFYLLRQKDQVQK